MTESAAPAGAGLVSPCIVAVDDDADARERVVNALERRYGADYHVVGYGSATSALDELARMREDGEAVSIVLADQWLPGTSGTELLVQAGEHHPGTRRGLLIEWGAWGHAATAEAIHAGMARGAFDYYLLKPWHSRDESVHRTVAEFLHEWSRLGDSTPHEFVVVGRRQSIRARELTDLLARNGVPHGFRPSDSAEGRRLLEEAGQAGSGRHGRRGSGRHRDRDARRHRPPVRRGGRLRGLRGPRASRTTSTASTAPPSGTSTSC